MSPTVRAPATLLFVLAVALLLVASPALALPGLPRVQEGSFAELKNAAREQVVVFYRSSNAAHQNALTEIDAAAAMVAADLPSLSFYACDGDSPINKAEFAEAGFKNDYYVFTATPGIGIARFPLPATASALASHLRDLYAHEDHSLVADIVSEDAFIDSLDDPSIPTVVKFYEDWCGHCRSLRGPFAIAAGQLRGRARFAQVRCSQDATTQAFCNKHGVTSFPSIAAFDGEGRGARYAYPLRSAALLREFVDRFIAGEGSVTAGSDAAAGAAAGVRISSEIGGEFIVNNDPTAPNAVSAASPPNSAAAAPASAPAPAAAATGASPAAAGLAGASLGTEASCAARVGTLERALEVLLARVEALEAAQRR